MSKRKYRINILCEQCGGNHFVREVRVYNSTENEVVFLCGYCDHINNEEITGKIIEREKKIRFLRH